MAHRSRTTTLQRLRRLLAAILTIAVSVALLVHTTNGGLTNITSLCSPHATPPLLRKGELTYVCINVNDDYRAVFMPVADKFTVLRVTDSWSDARIGANPDGAFVSVSSGAMRSFYKHYASPATGRVYPFMTAIISVKKGVVQGVTWDDGCYFCDPATCEPNLYGAAVNTSASRVADSGYTCYVPLASCGTTTTSATETPSNILTDAASSHAAAADVESTPTPLCDLTLYVGWTGTDKRGDYLASAGLRMSQFQKYSISSYFKKVANSFSNLLPSSRFDT